MKDSLIQAYSNSPKRKKLQILGSFFLVLVVLGVLLSSHLIISAHVIGMGRQLQEIKNEIDRLVYKNVSLRDQIARLKRIHRLEERAREMGFRPPYPGETFYVEVPGFEQQVSGEPPVSGPTHAVDINLSRKEYHVTLWEWVQEQLSLILKPFEEL
jgi:cell division protein FtsB